MIINREATLTLTDYEQTALSTARDIVADLLSEDLLDECWILEFLTTAKYMHSEFCEDDMNFNIIYEEG